MVRFLQISDIHFRRLPDARDEYAQLKARLFEKVREICTTLKVDCILICGDVAFLEIQKSMNSELKYS